jgi:hypothetical protein
MKKAKKNKLLTLQHTRYDKKKNFVFQQIFHLILITAAAEILADGGHCFTADY